MASEFLFLTDKDPNYIHEPYVLDEKDSISSQTSQIEQNDQSIKLGKRAHPFSYEVENLNSYKKHK